MEASYVVILRRRRYHMISYHIIWHSLMFALDQCIGLILPPFFSLSQRCFGMASVTSSLEIPISRSSSLVRSFTLPLLRSKRHIELVCSSSALGPLQRPPPFSAEHVRQTLVHRLSKGFSCRQRLRFHRVSTTRIPRCQVCLLWKICRRCW